MLPGFLFDLNYRLAFLTLIAQISRRQVLFCLVLTYRRSSSQASKCYHLMANYSLMTVFCFDRASESKTMAFAKLENVFNSLFEFEIN